MFTMIQKSANRDRSTAFTLIEVVAVLAVVALLIALVIPAVQASREAARRAQCVSNLRQLGLALNSYHASIGSLPHTNNGRKGFSVHTMILPYLELNIIHNSMNFDVPPYDDSNSTVSRTLVPCFLCPSDLGRNLHSTAVNYACNVGFGYQIDRTFNGMFVKSPAPPTTLADIPDGASTTAMMAEWVLGSGMNGNHDPLGSVYHTPVKLTKPNEFDQFVGVCDSLPFSRSEKNWVFKGLWWTRSGMGCSLYNHNLAINHNSCFNKSLYFEGTWTASSRHPAGANLLFADGHSRFARDSTTLPIWRAIGTRAGGEAVGKFDE